MHGEIRSGLHEAGVPLDRTDYIATKWLEYKFPKAFEFEPLNSSNVIVSGLACDNGYGLDLNQEYVYLGTTQDGRPYYQGTQRPDRYIYYDSHCADDTAEPRWLLGGKPDVSRTSGLNTHHGQGCDNDLAILSTSQHLPGGRQKMVWQWCGDHGNYDRNSVSIIYNAGRCRCNDNTGHPRNRILMVTVFL